VEPSGTRLTWRVPLAGGAWPPPAAGRGQRPRGRLRGRRPARGAVGGSRAGRRPL